MSAYGFEIVQTLIVDIEPDERVKKAMNEINAGEISMICLSCHFYAVFLVKMYLNSSKLNSGSCKDESSNKRQGGGREDHTD